MFVLNLARQVMKIDQSKIFAKTCHRFCQIQKIRNLVPAQLL